MKARLVIVVVVIVIAGIVGFFTVSSADVGSYNDETVDLMNDMDDVFTGYNTEMAKYYEGEQVRVDFMRAECEKIDEKVTATAQQLAGMSVPDVDACKIFHASVVAYVDNARDFCTAYRQVNDYIAEHNPPTEEDAIHVESLLTKLGEDEQRLIKDLVAKQKRMAEEYDLTLQ